VRPIEQAVFQMGREQQKRGGRVRNPYAVQGPF
jgi:hypothetical protein